MGTRATPDTGPAENRLLAALPPDEFRRIAARTEDVTLAYGDTVFQPHRTITHAYFPRTGILSTVVTMADGATVEVATVGNEGFAGIPLLLGADASPARVYCEVLPCSARRMDAAAFRDELRRGGPLADLARRYAQVVLTQASQAVACNCLHSVEERLAKWLLMTHDRVRDDEFTLTHEVLAQMLGVHRPSVTVAAGMLQKAGLIRYTRGRIAVLDRAGLESATCECYRVVHDELDRLLGAR